MTAFALIGVAVHQVVDGGALQLLARDIRDGVEGLRGGLKRLQEAIPSSDGLGVGLSVDLGF